MKKKIFVAGHNGMVGSAICRKLSQDASRNVVTVSRDDVCLTNQAQVDAFFSQNHFEEVYLAAAKVGGIHANDTYPAEFIYQNLMIQSNVIHAAFKSRVKRLLFLGSSCIYPRNAPQPMKEASLLRGALESTNEPYAIAKIAVREGILLQEFKYIFDKADERAPADLNENLGATADCSPDTLKTIDFDSYPSLSLTSFIDAPSM